MFDISFAELIVVLVVMIVFVSPKNLPLLSRGAGKIVQKIKNFTQEIKSELEREENFQELKKIERELKKRSIKKNEL